MNDKHNFDFKISDEQWNYFKKSLNNLLNVLKKYPISDVKKDFYDNCQRYLANFILFLSNIEGLKEEQINDVLKVIQDLVSHVPLSMSTYQIISTFFAKHYNYNNIDKSHKKLLEEIFFAFLKRFYCIGMNLYDKVSAKKYFTFYNICNILKEIDPAFVFASKYNFIFNSFLDWLNELNIYDRQTVLIYVVMPAYKSCEPEIKAKIETLSKKTFSEEMDRIEKLSFWDRACFAYEKIILGLQMLERGVLDTFSSEERKILKNNLEALAGTEFLNDILNFIEQIKTEQLENELNWIKDEIKKFMDEEFSKKMIDEILT